MHRTVVFDLHPGLTGFVEEVQGQLPAAVEHLHQAALQRCPEDLLLAVLVRAVGQRFLMDDPQPQQTFAHLLGHHCRAVVGQEGAGQAAFLDRLRESMHEILGGLGKVPLEVAAEPRMVVQDGQGDGPLPLAAGSEDLPRTVMEVEVPKRPHVLGFVAADLPVLASLGGNDFARAALRPHARLRNRPWACMYRRTVQYERSGPMAGLAFTAVDRLS